MKPAEFAPGSQRRAGALCAAAAFVAAALALPVPSFGAAPGQFWQERAAGERALPPGYSPLPSISGLVKELRPAVVNVYTAQVLRPAGRGQDPFSGFFGPNGSPFDYFGGGPRGELRQNSQGSGFIVSPDGYVLTNHHVVAQASEVKVKLADDRTFVAKLVGSDQKTDLALLKIESPEKLPYAFLGDSDALDVGDWVIAIGNPFGLGHTVTAGIISGKDRQIGHGPYDDFLQTDASINPGNSGGPLFDSAGDVVGINTAIVAGGNSVGFAVPINLVKSLLPQLKAGGKVIRGWLGVGIQELDAELAAGLGLAEKSGVLVGQVFAGGPAEKAGLQPGDVIVSLEGKPVADSRALMNRVAGYAPGAKVKVELLRDGGRKALTVTLAERDAGERMAMGGEPAEGEEQPQKGELGLSLSPLTADKARRLGLEDGVRGLLVEKVSPDGPAAGTVRPGDVLLEVNRQRVANPAEYRRALSAGARDRVLLRVQRGQVQVFVVVKRG